MSTADRHRPSGRGRTARERVTPARGPRSRVDQAGLAAVELDHLRRGRRRGRSGSGALISYVTNNHWSQMRPAGAAALRPRRPQPRRRQPRPAGHRRARRAGRHRRVRHRHDPVQPHGGAAAAAGARRQGRGLRRRDLRAHARLGVRRLPARPAGARHARHHARRAARAARGDRGGAVPDGGRAVRRRDRLHRSGTPRAASPRCSGCCWCCPASASCCPTTWQPHVLPYLPSNAGAGVYSVQTEPGMLEHVDGVRGALRLGRGRPGGGRAPAPPARRLSAPVGGAGRTVDAAGPAASPAPAWRAPGRRRHPRVVDALVASPCSCSACPATVHLEPTSRGRGSSTVALVAAADLAAAGARWRSSASLAAVALVQWALGLRLTADVALLVALYTVAASSPAGRGRRGRGPGGRASSSPRSGSPGRRRCSAPLVFLSGLVAAAFFIGTTVRNRRAYLGALVDRAARAGARARPAGPAGGHRRAGPARPRAARHRRAQPHRRRHARRGGRGDRGHRPAGRPGGDGPGRDAPAAPALAEMRRLLGVLRDRTRPTRRRPRARRPAWTASTGWWPAPAPPACRCGSPSAARPGRCRRRSTPPPTGSCRSR